MKLLIMGPETRTETEIALLERSKQYFESVLYVPITSVRIETVGEKSVPFYKNTNLFEFDAVISRINSKDTDIGYVLLKLFEDNGIYTVNSYKSVLYSYNEFLAPLFLKSEGLPTPKIHFATTRKAIEHVLPDLKYPVLLRLPYEKKGAVFIDSYDSAKGVIDTIEKLSQPILIQEIYEKVNPISILVLEGEIFCATDAKKPYRPTPQEKYTLKRAAELFEAGFCRIKAVKYNDKFVILGMDICPSVDNFQQIFEQDLYDVLLKHVEEKSNSFKNPHPVAKILKLLAPGKKK